MNSLGQNSDKLTDMFDKKQGFKLVCGAGNEDAIEVEKLVAIYSKAGCQFFDVSAKGAKDS